MQPAGFEPTIPASERPQIHSLDRAAIGIGFAQYSAAKYEFFLTLSNNLKFYFEGENCEEV
jgi:hypothetical protein